MPERSREELLKLTVVQLKNELKILNQPTNGSKDELVTRLLANSSLAPAVATPAPTGTAAATTRTPAAAAHAPASSAAAKPAEPAAVAPLGKHARIIFDDALAKSVPTKLVVVKPAAPVATPGAPDALTEEYKAKQRAEKFKDPQVEVLKNRAERFNIQVKPESESELARKRAERFGLSHPEIEAEKAKKRKERFGIEDPKAKLQARAERFKPIAVAKAPAAATGPALFGSVMTREQLEAKRKAAGKA